MCSELFCLMQLGFTFLKTSITFASIYSHAAAISFRIYSHIANGRATRGGVKTCGEERSSLSFSMRRRRPHWHAEMLIDQRSRAAIRVVAVVERKGPQERHLVWTIKCETGAERHICNYRITRCFSCITLANHKISLAHSANACAAASFLHVRPISEGDDSHTRLLANTHDRPHTHTL